MLIENQSTSETKIYLGKLLARAILLDFSATIFTKIKALCLIQEKVFLLQQNLCKRKLCAKKNFCGLCAEAV